jgi:hypothetical protein
VIGSDPQTKQYLADEYGSDWMTPVVTRFECFGARVHVCCCLVLLRVLICVVRRCCFVVRVLLRAS